jgi:hypothetical protein
VGVEEVAEHGDGRGEVLGGVGGVRVEPGGHRLAVAAADPGQLGAPGVGERDQAAARVLRVRSRSSRSRTAAVVVGCAVRSAAASAVTVLGPSSSRIDSSRRPAGSSALRRTARTRRAA